MDKKTALEILRLDEAATLAEAKKAYRSLAKQYHPDVMGKKISASVDTEAKMKDINLAFRYLVPLLKLSRPDKQPSNNMTDDDSSKKQPPGIKMKGLDMFIVKCEELINRLFPMKGKRVVSKNEKQYAKQKPKESKEPFNKVLEKIYQKPAVFEKRKSGIPKKRIQLKSNFLDDYQKYSRMMRKMKPGHSPDSDMSIGRVTKIDPVNRIDPVKKD
jgi:DnaJ-class molecular chaperone